MTPKVQPKSGVSPLGIFVSEWPMGSMLILLIAPKKYVLWVVKEVSEGISRLSGNKQYSSKSREDKKVFVASVQHVYPPRDQLHDQIG